MIVETPDVYPIGRVFFVANQPPPPSYESRYPLQCSELTALKEVGSTRKTTADVGRGRARPGTRTSAYTFKAKPRAVRKHAVRSRI